MKIECKGRSGILLAAAALSLLIVTGCSHGSSPSETEDYKKAAMGSKLPPEMEAKMRAAVQKQQADDAARQASAMATPGAPAPPR